MKSPTIEEVLERAGDAPMRTLTLPTRALRLVSSVPIDPDTPANEHLEELRIYEPDVVQMTIAEIIKQNNKGSNNNHRCSTVSMTIIMGVMALVLTGVQVYVAVKTLTLPQWNDMIIPLVGPLMIVWYERGILRKENRDMLQALLGRTPMTMAEAATDYFTRKRRQAEQPIVENEVVIVEDHPGRTKATKTTDY